MRNYGVIPTDLWTDQMKASLSCDVKHLYMYFCTSPHTTFLGCFRLPIGYMIGDLGWSNRRLKKALIDCIEYDLVAYDHQSAWLYIRDFHLYNPIQNPNQWLSIKKLLLNVPQQLYFYPDLLKGILSFENKIPSEDYDHLKAALDQLTVSETTAEQLSQPLGERSPEPLEEPLPKRLAVTEDLGPRKNDRKENIKHTVEKTEIVAPIQPVDDKKNNIEIIFDFWRNIMGHPKAKLDDKRQSHIRKALKLGYSVTELCHAITGCSYTPHNMGQNDRHERYDGLHVILRDADQIDRFINNHHNPPQLKPKKNTTADRVAGIVEWGLEMEQENIGNGSH